MEFLDFETAVLDDGRKCNRRKTDDGQAAQNSRSHRGRSAWSATWTRAREAALPDEVDPLRDDLAVKLVELRSAMKIKNPELAGGLKVAANSAAFGIFSQLDVRSLDSRSPLRVFSGETNYLTPPTEIWERPSEFYCPVIASLVTGGSHLLFGTILARSSDGLRFEGKGWACIPYLQS